MGDGNKANTTSRNEQNKYSDIPVQENGNETSTKSKHDAVNEVTKKPSTSVVPVQNEDKQSIVLKQTPLHNPLEKPTRIVVLKPPTNDEKPVPKSKKKQNNTPLRNQSKITSLFKPVNKNTVDHRNVSEVPQYRQTEYAGREVSATWVSQINLNASESSQSLGDTNTSPDLATN